MGLHDGADSLGLFSFFSFLERLHSGRWRCRVECL
jgi:hypothetical protein